MIRTDPTRVKEKSAKFRGFAPILGHAMNVRKDPPGVARPRVVLASGSAYRAQLLGRLCDRFDVRRTDIDEAPLPGEDTRALGLRLARLKADAARTGSAGAGEIIIGSDQVADLDGRALGKPGTLETNKTMLARCSGRSVIFYTAVCVLDTRHDATEDHLDVTEVHFRPLAEAEIEAYVLRDRALDCAGGFKLEKAGTSLFTKVISEDPTAIIGLPLIWLAAALRRTGWRLGDNY